LGRAYNRRRNSSGAPGAHREALVGKVAERLEAPPRERTAALDVGVEKLEIVSNHVHPLVPVPPIDAPRHHVNRFKGYASRVSWQEFAYHRTRLPFPRSYSYHIGAASHISVNAIQRYIALRRGCKQVRRIHKYWLYLTQ
jgi:REP element-mobilizing transposase RayT